ncbi:hypothetical protein A4R27_21220 [Priestia endophytica]|nr:hypothetical protein A4R27_21220 [Priestia endophytica]RAS86534.1 hypothetical protein A4U60_07515 [Priestia endophytica]
MLSSGVVKKSLNQEATRWFLGQWPFYLVCSLYQEQEESGLLDKIKRQLDSCLFIMKLHKCI